MRYAHCGWVPKYINCADREGKLGISDCGGTCGRGPGGHILSLPPVLHPMGAGRSERDHAQEGQGGAVPDGLHYWERPPSVPECILPGPQTQHRTLNGTGVLSRCLPEGLPALRKFSASGFLYVTPRLQREKMSFSQISYM